MCRNIFNDLPALDRQPQETCAQRVRIKKLLLFVKNLRRGKPQSKMRAVPVPWWKMLALHTGMERLRLEAGAGPGPGSGRQQHPVHAVPVLLPPSITLPDGEEFPYGSSARMHIRDPEQESEIYQKCIRPPPNRTVFDGESPPPYRSVGAGGPCQGGGTLPPAVIVPRKPDPPPAPGAAPFPAGPGKHSTNPVHSAGAGLIRLPERGGPRGTPECRTAQCVEASPSPSPSPSPSSSPGGSALAALTMVPCRTDPGSRSAVRPRPRPPPHV